MPLENSMDQKVGHVEVFFLLQMMCMNYAQCAMVNSFECQTQVCALQGLVNRAMGESAISY